MRYIRTESQLDRKAYVLEAIQGLYKDYKCNLHSKEETRDEHGNGAEMGEPSQDPQWLGLSEQEIVDLQLAGVEVPEYAVDDLRERRRASTRERYEQSLREEAEERRQRDTVAIVPYIGRPSVGSDEAGPSRVRSEVPEGEMPLRKRVRSSVIADEQTEWTDIHVIPTPVLPIPVPSPVPSPLPKDEVEEDPSEDADTESVPSSPPLAPPPVAAPSPAAVPLQGTPILAGDQIPAILLTGYLALQGQLEESRRMIDTLLQRSDRGRGGVIPDGVSVGLVSVELRAFGDIRRLLADRGDPAWRAAIVDTVTSMVVQIRDVIRAGL
ncbi:hypothetical protein POM88_026213 [Heracleum sosnowskyi]|uniref:Uncharacterized protein n=1 Tax=Heracleum sosnowskyi TaxID=360622 RepID=A0AAD8I6P2_9APIA|nr:hypothetical protein POM88_026213 [Heracleum sosnowskyi]